MNWDAVFLSLKLATWTALILLCLSMPLAYWLAFSRRRWKFVVEALVALPIVLPPTVLGFYILVVISPRSPLGQLYQEMVGKPLPFSFEGLLLASILYSLPFAVQPLATAFAGVDRSLVEASWTLGETRLGTFFRIVVPQSIYGVLTALVLSFAHTVGEFGVVLMVGGNIEGITRTVSIDIYDDVQALDYAGAGTTSLVLLVFSFLVLAFLYSLNRRHWSPWPRLTQ